MSAHPTTETFATNERVLCYHGPLIYEAKVLKVETWEPAPGRAGGPHYFVHYKGWKQTCVGLSSPPPSPPRANSLVRTDAGR